MLGLIPYIRNNLLRNRRRTILTLLSIAASVFLVVVLEAILRHLDDMPHVDGSERRLVVRRNTNFKDSMPQTYNNKIRNVKGVKGTAAIILYWGIYKELRAEYFFGKMAIDADTLAENYPETRVVDPVTGAPRPELTDEFIKDRRGASAGRGLYQKYGWKLGDRITFQGIGFPDVEVTLRSCYDGQERSSFYFHRDYLDELMGRAGQVTFFNIICNTIEDCPLVAARIDAEFANSDAPTVTETERAFQAQWVSMLGNVRVLLRSIALACAFAMVCVAANTLAMSARERAHEIAIMKTLGFTPGALLILLLIEVAVLCGLASAAGAGAAKLLFQFEGPWTDIGNGFLLGFRVPAWLALAAVPFGVFVGWCAALPPFLRVTTAPIAPALRRIV
ncbi:MAG: hypothetical protein HY286_14765 [Planctomycetes bacterium]|nr:hypothetical protein [Planctomycetota bacterium]